MERQLTVGSLFAGIGGFDLGFERAGFRVKWACEIDPHAQAVLRARFPHTRIVGDITQFQPVDDDRVDVVVGGFPCQDVSTAGLRAGLAGARSGLFYDAMRIVRRLRPEIVVVENVVGLLSSNRGADFATVVREMADGWDCSEVCWRVLDSRYFGVAQRRRRVFIVASRAIGRAEQVLAFTSCGGRRASAGRKARKENPNGTAPSLRANSNPVGIVAVDLYNANITEGASPTVTAACGLVSGTGPKVGVGFPVFGIDRDKNCTVDHFGTPQAGARSHQFTAYGGKVRQITPVEAERLQGFPDGWTDVGPPGRPTANTHRYRQCGNAVTVNVAEWLARNAARALSQQSCRNLSNGC